MRDEVWLKDRFEKIWEMAFPDVTRMNNVRVRFLGRWKNKFGHIKKLKNEDTEIVINGLFKEEAIPEYIIDLTLAHEIVHYSHGFSSPLPKKYKHPHAGGVVRRELKARGLGPLLRKERGFVKNEWVGLYKQLCPDKTLRRRIWF
ncbi:MAG: hypothetical protein V1914_03900 [archaeon]